MELMATCLDKLTKRYRKPIPEDILGKISVAVSSFENKIFACSGLMHLCIFELMKCVIYLFSEISATRA